MDETNRALSEIELQDDSGLVHSAMTFDRALAELMRRARDREYTRDEWRETRGRVIDEALGQFKATGRKYVRSGRLGLTIPITKQFD